MKEGGGGRGKEKGEKRRTAGKRTEILTRVSAKCSHELQIPSFKFEDSDDAAIVTNKAILVVLIVPILVRNLSRNGTPRHPKVIKKPGFQNHVATH